jgi:hypothetical protein
VGHASGNVIVYEEQLAYETPEEHYKHIHIIRIPPDTSDANDRVVRALSINTTEEIVIATTNNSQIFYFALASAEIKVRLNILNPTVTGLYTLYKLLVHCRSRVR